MIQPMTVCISLATTVSKRELKCDKSNEGIVFATKANIPSLTAVPPLRPLKQNMFTTWLS